MVDNLWRHKKHVRHIDEPYASRNGTNGGERVMAVREIVPGIFSVGVIDWDRRIFDELIPLPDGTTYNSYLIRGSKKIALLDTVDPAKTAELMGNLKALRVEKIDYVVSHHAEQDHSGSIPAVLEQFSGAKVVTNQKCRDFLADLLHIPDDRFIVVGDVIRSISGGRRSSSSSPPGFTGRRRCSPTSGKTKSSSPATFSVHTTRRVPSMSPMRA